jgi:Domain of unknown function (DUF4394)
MIRTNKWRKLLVVSATILLSALIAAPLVHADDQLTSANDLTVIGLTGTGHLVSFQSSSPQISTLIGSVEGLGSSDTKLIGIDFRVQDGLLYGVGNGGGVYTIDTQTAQASFVNSLSEQLQGRRFGVDFNPAANRLRIISNTGQNLRHDVTVTGATTPPTVVDGPLNFPPVPPATTSTTALGVTGAAYTNNDLEPTPPTVTGTTLFDIDTTNDQIVLQSPANSGILVPTGKLGVDTGNQVGFDIYSDLVNGLTVRNRAFAVLAVNGVDGFYKINLLTGDATFIGNFTNNGRIIDIAIPLNQ